MISIHALLAESDWIHHARLTANTISIHALLAESDRVESGQRHLPRNFYPRSPCGERRGHDFRSRVCQGFLSTLSLRRATRVNEDRYGPQHFYPRSPCGERPNFRRYIRSHRAFLSTLSLRRATDNVSTPDIPKERFLSTLSLRRATADTTPGAGSARDFYPRSPCGERPRGEHHASTQQEFLSTLSLRRATVQIVIVVVHALFLSTLSLRRATGWAKTIATKVGNFYPRSPCGERLPSF